MKNTRILRDSFAGFLGAFCFAGVSHAIVADDLTGNGIVTIYTDHDETGNDGLVIKAGQAGSYPTVGTDPLRDAYAETTIASFSRSSSSISTSLGVTGATTLSSTLGVTGATTLDSTLGVSGATTLSNSLFVNTTGARLTVNTSANQASLTASGGQGVTVNGSTSTQIKGGTNSGTLTLQDGNATGGGTPNGTSLTISGSGGGVAATVLQTTTNATTTQVTTLLGTSAVYSGGSTATLQAGPGNVVTVNSGNTGTASGVYINGVVGTGSTSATGVLITGSGQNGRTYTSGTVPTWADVAIQSLSYGLGNPALGSAILVTDYGVQIVSPQPTAGQQVTNNMGQNNGAGNVTNTFGAGTGVTNNFIGNNNPQSTVQLDGGPSRMTLNSQGATFSNPATGGPISVRGVADGASPFDAVNVRQLFGAIATTMATAPQNSDLKPGETGIGVGTGHYGGYSAMGISVSHYSNHGVQLNLGIARGFRAGTENAVRAGLGWKF